MESGLKEGKYIYCIIESAQPQSFGPLGIGQRGDEVYSVCFGAIAAVVSDSPIKRYPVSSDNTFAHEKAIEEVMKKYPVLPVRFATIAENEEKVKKILEKEYERCIGLLNEIKGKKELGLKAMFKREIVYEEILEQYKEIRRLKEIIAAKPPAETYRQRMKIGEMVEQALEKEKQKHKDIMLDILKPLAEDMKINNTYGERMILNAAFLVDETKEPEFDRKVQDLDAEYSRKIKFKYVGTLPPFNFVNLVIQPGENGCF